jgi:hypothetical protein
MTALPEVPPLLQRLPLLLSQLLREAHLIKEEPLPVLPRGDYGLWKRVLKEFGRVQFLLEGGDEVQEYLFEKGFAFLGEGVGICGQGDGGVDCLEAGGTGV